MILDFVIGLIAIVGGMFTLIAAAGLVKFPDVFMRMHASTKAGTLGASLCLIVSMLFFQDTEVSVKAVLAIIFLMLTGPIAAHLIGRAANTMYNAYSRRDIPYEGRCLEARLVSESRLPNLLIVATVAPRVAREAFRRFPWNIVHRITYLIGRHLR